LRLSATSASKNFSGRGTSSSPTDQGGLLDPGGVQERYGVGGEVVDGVAAVRTLRVAVAALVQSVGVVAGGQQGSTRL
jgi:hypothetical protein